MNAYYNENDPFAAAWLRELIRRNVIASGDVDERSIVEVRASDLTGYAQCHFFAGIGVWSYALRCAGWPEDKPVWTGSCPCQPFSVSGKRGRASDGRHLWPVWFPLIRECRPGVVFGEQVASDDGLAWLDLVSSDLENEDYTIGAVDTCAAGFGAPQISQRLWFVAETASERCREERRHLRRPSQWTGDSGKSLCVESTSSDGFPWRHGSEILGEGERETRPAQQRYGSSCGMGETQGLRLQGWWSEGDTQRRETEERHVDVSNGAVRGYWADADWVWCRDERYRPFESSAFPLAYGAARRVGRLRGYGNAIVAPQAQAFIEAAMIKAKP